MTHYAAGQTDHLHRRRPRWGDRPHGGCALLAGDMSEYPTYGTSETMRVHIDRLKLLVPSDGIISKHICLNNVETMLTKATDGELAELLRMKIKSCSLVEAIRDELLARLITRATAR